MSKSRISVLFLVALAQQFSVVNAVAAPCPDPDTHQKSSAAADCPPNPDAPPDLVPSISNLSFSPGKVVVAMSISNQGKASSPTATRVELKVRGSGPVIHAQDLATGAVQSSAPLALSAHAALPPGSHLKTLEICVTADAVGQVQESSENNNRICKPLFVPSLHLTLP